MGFDRAPIAAAWRFRAMLLVALSPTAGCTGTAASNCQPFANDADVGGSVIHCPDLVSIQVAPSEAAVGGSVALVANVADLVEGGAILFSWSSPSGQFADSTSPLTTFTCTEAGMVTVTITATQEGCSESTSSPVDCVSP